jgi:hypothetical protein
MLDFMVEFEAIKSGIEGAMRAGILKEAQIPAAMQFASTPMHLLGLDLYNRQPAGGLRWTERVALHQGIPHPHIDHTTNTVRRNNLAHARKATRHIIPTAMQFASTPMHLLGLDLYNRQPAGGLRWTERVARESLIRTLTTPPIPYAGTILPMRAKQLGT